ncbi:MAG: hypothetical protein KTR31_40150 [Myxococcales bacterium]|nr:hypothetical protein [Myxococcales bacterium]
MLGFSLGSLCLVLPLAVLELPAWLATGLAVAPLALVMLGQTVLEEAVQRRWVRTGDGLERLGAWWYLGVWLAGLVIGIALGSGEALAGWLGGMLALPAIHGLFQGASDRARGVLPELADPFADGRAVASPEGATPASLVRVIGVDTLVMGGICAAFAALAVVLLVREGHSTQGWITLLFFGGGAFVGVQIAATRWATFVPGRHHRTMALSRLAMGIGGGSMLVALFGFALFWPGLGWFGRALLGGAGVLAVGALVVAFVRRLRGTRVGSVAFVRQGLQVVHARIGVAVWRWDDVVDLRIVDVSGNLAVGVVLREDALPVLPGPPTDDVLAKLASARGWSRGLHGADLVFLAIHMADPPRAWLEEAALLWSRPEERKRLPEA